jgi:hypothetical protein
MDQKEMFENGEDLPLFSGSPQKALESRFVEQIENDQDLIFDCHLCYDTGSISNGDLTTYCGCAKGEWLRKLERVLVDASEYLQGVCEINISHLLYEKFSTWVQQEKVMFDDFQSAWAVYQEERL